MATSNHTKAGVCLAFLIVLSCAFWPLGGQTLEAANAGSPGGNAGAIVGIAPSDSAFVLEIDSFEYTLSTVDQFLQGVSPLPMGLRMLVRAQLGQILGNPALPGLDMNGTVGAFAMAPANPVPPDQIDPENPDHDGFTAILVPVTDYNQFISANPNCGSADAQGVSKLDISPTDTALIKQAGSYAFVAGEKFYDQAIAVANDIAAAAAAPAQAGADVFVPQVAGKPVRLFIDVKKLVAGAAPAMDQVRQMQAGGQQAQGLPPQMMSMDFSAMAENLDLEFVTVGLSASADVLNLSADAVALPNSKLASTFTRGSQELAASLMMLQARPPSQMGPDLASVQALLPGAGNADLVGKLNLVELIQLAAMMSPMQVPPIDIKATGSGAYAITADNGAITIDVALPKQHLTEIITASMTMSDTITMLQDPQMPQPQQLPQPQLPALPEVSTPTAPEPVAIAPDDSSAAGGRITVRVAGARLVRYSDIKQGILPLGQTDGYTLSLLAELPEPALKISGGVIEKATTSTGKSLLPQHSWQRNIGFSKLSADGRTALFNVELALPDYAARSLEEISGQLEYVTGSGGKEVDLGVVAMKAGTRGQALNAVISSVQEDPYGNNESLVGLKVNLPPEALKSVAISAGAGSPLVVNPRSPIAMGSATTFRLPIRGKLPPQARIVLTVYERFNRTTVPFRLTQISLTGEPAG